MQPYTYACTARSVKVKLKIKEEKFQLKYFRDVYT
jgi:hypothetical protein